MKCFNNKEHRFKKFKLKNNKTLLVCPICGLHLEKEKNGKFPQLIFRKKVVSDDHLI